VKANKQATTANLIAQLNPVIRGWANYHRHVASKVSAWTKIFISVMTLTLTDMLRTEPLLAETSTNRTSL